MNNKKLTARQYLTQLQELDTNINQDLERLEDMKTNACSTGGIDYSAERVQTSPSGDSLCKAVTNYVDFNEQINREIDKFSDAKEQIIKQIRGLHNARYSQVLFKVYVACLSFSEPFCWNSLLPVPKVSFVETISTYQMYL